MTKYRRMEGNHTTAASPQAHTCYANQRLLSESKSMPGRLASPVVMAAIQGEGVFQVWLLNSAYCDSCLPWGKLFPRGCPKLALVHLSHCLGIASFLGSLSKMWQIAQRFLSVWGGWGEKSLYCTQDISVTHEFTSDSLLTVLKLTVCSGECCSGRILPVHLTEHWVIYFDLL